VVRSLALIVAAIRLSRPEIPDDEANRYATVLQHEAKQHGFDPFTVVAIVHHESGWQPDALSADGEDHGLGQIRARYVGACRGDADPVNAPSQECKAVKAALLDGVENLRAMAALIAESRKLCLKKARSQALPRWLASYQGYNFPEKRRWCQPGKKTWEVVRYRQKLVDELVYKRRPPARAQRRQR
jgi:hypothetical protein